MHIINKLALCDTNLLFIVDDAIDHKEISLLFRIICKSVLLVMFHHIL